MHLVTEAPPTAIDGTLNMALPVVGPVPPSSSVRATGAAPNELAGLVLPPVKPAKEGLPARAMASPARAARGVSRSPASQTSGRRRQRSRYRTTPVRTGAVTGAASAA